MIHHQGMPPHFDLLYTITCDERNAGNHPVPAFRDAPIESRNSRLSARAHFNGKVELFDLEAYMEDETDGVAFVVIRTVECSEASVVKARAGSPLRWTEDIYMKSIISKNAMKQIATSYFQPVPKEDQFPHHLSPRASTENIRAPFEQNRITPADLFLFHHRHLLRTHALEHSESKLHINALLDYVDNRFGMEFTEAENLFERGLVAQEHILNLFKPNELIISGTYGRPAAFVLHEWPKLGGDGWVTLSCWSFQTDGSGFARKQSILSIPPIASKTMKIHDLVAYPFHLATPEIRDMIRSRGEKQWELRTATHVTYKGWNVEGDQFFVSPQHVFFTRTFR
jgi:hypothetical protein